MDLIAPEQVIDRGDALILVIVAGEIFAELQPGLRGAWHEPWRKILSEVDEFRASAS